MLFFSLSPLLFVYYKKQKFKWINEFVSYIHKAISMFWEENDLSSISLIYVMNRYRVILYCSRDWRMDICLSMIEFCSLNEWSWYSISLFFFFFSLYSVLIYSLNWSIHMLQIHSLYSYKLVQCLKWKTSNCCRMCIVGWYAPMHGQLRSNQLYSHPSTHCLEVPTTCLYWVDGSYL